MSEFCDDDFKIVMAKMGKDVEILDLKNIYLMKYYHLDLN